MGFGHTCAVRGDGTLWCWGWNLSGQLGDGSTTDRLVPVRIGGSARWASVTPGYRHTCAVRTDGTLWCWGNNDFGQLGDGTTTDRLTPTRVGTQAGWAGVTAGISGSCAIRTDRTLWCWGAFQDWQRPQPVGIGPGTDWVSVSASGGDLQYGLCAVRAAGTLWCGPAPDRLGQIGQDTTWATLTSGDSSSCAIRRDATLWRWGLNDYGQVGDGSTVERQAPVRVDTPLRWTAVALGRLHTCALARDHTLWCWGLNENGMIGSRTLTNSPVPLRVGADRGWVAVCVGYNYSCALRRDHTLWGWGPVSWMGEVHLPPAMRQVRTPG